MKINLIYGEGDILNTHLNLHPFAMQETDDVKIADVKNIDRFVCDGEAEEIVALDVLDYLVLYEVTKVIGHWVQKLKIGGTLIIGGTDMTLVCKSFAEGDIDLETANKMLHGIQTQPHLVKRVNLTLLGVCNFLMQDCQGLQIMKKRYNGHNYIIEVRRGS
jgi:predicted SAM-dependent methyltransferase